MTEDAYLRTLIERLGGYGADVVVAPGDDCAALLQPDGELLLVAVDQIVAGRHLVLDGPDAATPERAGRKLLARNLSDIAAMGGVPTHCLVAAAVRPGTDACWLDRFFAGITALAAPYGVAMIGGDLARAPHDTVASLTILGTVSANRVCRRSGADAGCRLVATGCFGASLPTGHHLDFEPRVREGQWLAGNGFARAMIDVSDGLLLDAQRLCRASGLALTLDTAVVPRRGRGTTLRQALVDGEDYELLAAVRAEDVDELFARWPFGGAPALTCIGTFVHGNSGVIQDERGTLLSAGDDLGYDHFRDSGDA